MPIDVGYNYEEEEEAQEEELELRRLLEEVRNKEQVNPNIDNTKIRHNDFGKHKADWIRTMRDKCCAKFTPQYPFVDVCVNMEKNDVCKVCIENHGLRKTLHKV